MKIIVHLFRTRKMDLSVIQLNKMCSTPVHAAAMISIETGCLDLLSYVCEMYQFPEDGKIVNNDNETPFHIVLKSSGKKKHITSVCEVLQAANKINPYVVDNQEKTAKYYCKQPERKSLLQKAEECWGIKMSEKPEKSLSSTNKLCESSNSFQESELNSINEHEDLSNDDKIPSVETCETPTEKQEVASNHVESPISSISKLLSSFDGIFSPHTDTVHTNVKRVQGECYEDEEVVEDKPMVESLVNCSVKLNDKETMNRPLVEPVNERFNGDKPIEMDMHLVEPVLEHIVEFSADKKLTDTEETDKTDRLIMEEPTNEYTEEMDCDMNLQWEVIISKQASDFLKASKTPRDIIKRIREVLEKIGNGDRSKAVIHKCLQPEDKLYETKLSKGARLLWQESIEYSEKLECYTDVVKVLWITLRHNKTQLNDVIQRVKTALAKSRKCHSKSLVLISNPRRNDLIHKPRTFAVKGLDHGCNISQNEVFHQPTPNVYDGEFSVMQFHPFNEFLDVILSEDPSKRECPIQMSEEEHKILKLPYSSPILLSGRSGTGKTTTCLYRLWNAFVEYWKKMPQELDDSCVHQIFITKSPVLCSKVREQFDKLLFGRADIPENFNRTPIKDVHNIEKLGHKQFPLFSTFHQFLLLLDSSLPDGSFFPRNGKGELLINICNSDYDENKDPDALFEDLGEQLQNTNVHPKWTVVTADYFSRKWWNHFGDYGKKLDSLLVWTEIQSFIKGSHEALMSEEGHLTRDQYLNLGKKQAPMFYDEDESKSFIYDCFEKYEKHKMDENCGGEDNHYFDENDFVHHIYHRLKEYKNNHHQPQWYINEFYIDEIQDFTQSELCVLLLCSRNVNRTFCTGDIAQTIMKGVHFRFEDLKSQFWNLVANCEGRNNSKIHLQHLTQNFRSHSGILNLSQSILEILRNRKYFHYSYLDGKIGNEEAVFTGPKPILLDTSSPTDLVSVMLGSGDDSSVIHELGAHQAIIVRSQEEKDNLPDSLKNGIVLTVLESKGLEFNDVLLYNFFSGMKSEVPIPWILLNNLIEEEFKNEPFFSEKKQNILPHGIKIHFMHTDKREKQLKSLSAELKHLYTAITRARKNLWIYEDSTELRMPAFYYWQMKDLVTVVDMNDIHENTLLFAASSEEEQWEKQGDLFFKMRKWKLAMLCYEKANKINQVSLARGYMLVEKAARSPNQPKDLYIEAALYLLMAGIGDHNEQYFKNGILCLQQAGLHNEVARAAEKIKEYELARTEWLKAGNYCEVARLDELLFNYSQAVRCFLKQKDYKSALSKSVQFEKNGESLDFDVRPQQVANKLLKEKIAAGKCSSEDATIISEFISFGVIKAGFLEQIGLHDLAVDELIKENKLQEACMLLKRKFFFLKGLEEPKLSENHTEFLFFHSAHLLKQNDKKMNSEIIECFSKLQQPSVPPLYRAHSHYVMAKFSGEKSLSQCYKALKNYELANNALGKANVNKLLMNTEKGELCNIFMMAEEAYQIAQYFELQNIHGLRQTMEFYFLESTNSTTYSIATPIMEIFSDEFQHLRDTAILDGIVHIDKKQVHAALHNHYLKLSRSFLENEKTLNHYVKKVCPVIQTAPFYNRLCNGLFSESFLHTKFNFENYFDAVKNVIVYQELLGYYSEIDMKPFIKFFAPYAAYSVPSYCFRNLKSSKFVCEYMKRRAIDVVNQESATLDDFLLAWRILAVFAGSYEGRGIINLAMSKASIYIITINEKPIHIFNGWIVSLKQMYHDHKITNSIWSMYNYVFSKIARIDDPQKRDAALSVSSITYTISVFSTALMSMIVSAHCILTPDYPGPPFLLPDFYRSLVYNHDSVHTGNKSNEILSSCLYEVSEEIMLNPLKTLQNYTYQLKTLLMFLVGQDKNKYNILQVALKSVSCHRDGSALYCLSLCLILSTNLFKYFSVDQYDEKEKRSMQDLLLTVHKTVRECNCFGKTHFISLAYNELKIARNTNDLFTLVKKLFLQNKLNVYFKQMYLMNNKVQFKLVDQQNFPKCSIKALVIIEKPSDKEQEEKLENDKDPEGGNIMVSSQQLLREIKDLQEATLVESPYIKNNQCSICGCDVERESQLHLNSNDHLSNEELFMKFSQMISDIFEQLQCFQKEMKSIEESIIEVDVLLKECKGGLQEIRLLELEAKENCTWRDGIHKLTEISQNYQQQRKQYHDIIREMFQSTKEQVLQSQDHNVDLSNIVLPDETQPLTLNKKKRLTK